jgi:predicted transcriptional regulator
VRTTIDMSPEHRARLLELAARRGEKGFSRLVAEALDAFLSRQREDEAKLRAALDAAGALSSAEAERLRKVTSRLRESWR